MLRERRQIESQVRQIIDVLLLLGSLWLAHTIRRHLGHELGLRRAMLFREEVWLAVIVAIIGHFSLKAHGFYLRSINQSPGRVFWTVFQSMGVCVLIVLALLFVLDVREVNRATIFLFGVISSVAIWVFDGAWKGLVILSVSHRQHRRAVVLVGSPHENEGLVKQIHDHPEWGMEVVSQINLNVQSVEELAQLIRDRPVDVVIFTSGKSYLQEVESAILACEVEGVEAWLVADFVHTSIARPVMGELMGQPMIVFHSGPNVSWALLCKNVLDRVLSAVLLVLFAPLMLLIALAIRLTSPGPILFRQERCGLRGRVFTMLKFRSMVSDAAQRQSELAAINEMDGPVFKIANDPRVTPLGRFLRRTSLDELPQLINVLKGELSLVGPRPLPVYEIKRFKDPWQRRRLSMKPGMTCLWQIAGRNKIGFEEWMRLDLEYIDSWSLWLDLKILLKTIPVVIKGQGAH
ncbi:MAG: sugar transferase [Verrucomicrobiae bacterium]|nr:sugar transferase [Verrucomicrobiae bacterium]